MSSSSSSSSDSSSNPNIIFNPESNGKTGAKFKTPVARGSKKRDTESGMSSIDSKPSIKLPPKTSDLRFNPQVVKKPAPNQGPVQRLRSIKYEQKKESLSSSGELSSDSDKSSMINQAEQKHKPIKPVDPAVKVLNPVDIPLKANRKEKSYEPVLNHIPLNDKPLPPVKPEVQPNRPSVPKLKLEKIDPSIKPAQTNLPNLKVGNEKPVAKAPVAVVNGLEDNQKNIAKPALRSEKYVRKEKESSSSKSSESSESSESSKGNLDSPGSGIHDESDINIAIDKPNKKAHIEPMSSEKSSSNHSSESSSDSENQTSLINADDSIFKEHENKKSPSIIIPLKPNREIEVKQPEFHEVELDHPIQSNPPAGSVKFLTYKQLFTYINSYNHQNDLLFDRENLCEKLCKCMAKSESITPHQSQELLKLQKLCLQTFDSSDEFHRYLLYSYYSRFTSSSESSLDDKTAKLIGLSNNDEKRNELSKPYALGSLLHLIFLFENKPALMRTLSSAKRKDNCTFINLCMTLLTQSFNLLKSKKINQIFKDEQNAVQVFFEFHSGFIEIWAELSGSDEFSSSVREATSRAIRNPMLCRQVFNK